MYLKNIDVKSPEFSLVGSFWIGKSSLSRQILLKRLAKRTNRIEQAKDYKTSEDLTSWNAIIAIDQSPIGKNTNPILQLTQESLIRSRSVCEVTKESKKQR